MLAPDITISIGATLLDGLTTIDQTLATCDTALLQAKRTRNSVEVTRPDTRRAREPSPLVGAA